MAVGGVPSWWSLHHDGGRHLPCCHPTSTLAPPLFLSTVQTTATGACKCSTGRGSSRQWLVPDGWRSPSRLRPGRCVCGTPPINGTNTKCVGLQTGASDVHGACAHATGLPDQTRPSPGTPPPPLKRTALQGALYVSDWEGDTSIQKFNATTGSWLGGVGRVGDGTGEGAVRGPRGALGCRDGRRMRGAAAWLAGQPLGRSSSCLPLS